MVGDGNCLFRSLAHPSLDHRDVRTRTADQIEREWEGRYRHFLTEDEQTNYRERARRDGEWGNELVLAAFADVYGRRVVVHDRTTLRPLHTYGTGDALTHVAFSGCHYDAVRLDGGTS